MTSFRVVLGRQRQRQRHRPGPCRSPCRVVASGSACVGAAWDGAGGVAPRPGKPVAQEKGGIQSPSNWLARWQASSQGEPARTRAAGRGVGEEGRSAVQDVQGRAAPCSHWLADGNEEISTPTPTAIRPAARGLPHVCCVERKSGPTSPRPTATADLLLRASDPATAGTLCEPVGKSARTTLSGSQATYMSRPAGRRSGWAPGCGRSRRTADVRAGFDAPRDRRTRMVRRRH
jgi:hypothetical protein